MDHDHDDLISQFCSVTGAAPHDAEPNLAANQWNLEAAVANYYASQEEVSDNEMDAEPNDPSTTPAAPSGGRTLGGTSASASASVSSASSSSAQPSSIARKPPPARGLRILRDLNQGGADSHAHGEGSDDEDEEQEFFAGGEKSGLAVQNPDGASSQDHIKKILQRAEQNAPRPGGDDEDRAPTTRFRGSGVTLGGEGQASRTIPDPTAALPRAPERVHRTLHLWHDGFSIDDGPLYRYDDPANSATLAMIHQGRAPLNLLNIQHGQEVDLVVSPHKDEDYVQPKQKYKPFSGSGQRLGSPVPSTFEHGSAGATSQQPTVTTGVATTATATSSSASSSAAPTADIDPSQPTLQLQIRLADGTRLQSRFNTSQTVGHVRAFVNAARPATRPWTLMTTFPTKELKDEAQVLGEMAEFKRGGVVVQKWV